MIEERAYAKINLTLEVLDAREDGYHPTNTVMIPVNLYDTLTFTDYDEIIYRPSIEFENDIVLKAMRLFYQKYNIKKGCIVTLDKGIPTEAGLAGGSSDAAACLRGLNKLFGVNAPLSELEELANMLGTDVSYCLYQKPAYCTGRGEIVNLLDTNYDKYNITLIKPEYGLSTKAIYQAYTYQELDRTNNTNNVINGLKNNDINLIKNNIFNDLSKVSVDMTPLKEIYDDIKNLGYDVYLSGSGPTLYILNDNPDLKSLKTKYDGIQILNTKLL